MLLDEKPGAMHEQQRNGEVGEGYATEPDRDTFQCWEKAPCILQCSNIT